MRIIFHRAPPLSLFSTPKKCRNIYIANGPETQILYKNMCIWNRKKVYYRKRDHIFLSLGWSWFQFIHALFGTKNCLYLKIRQKIILRFFHPFSSSREILYSFFMAWKCCHGNKDGFFCWHFMIELFLLFIVF
jgi:hypothetical protein